ncbi:hypothetical protein JCM3774_000876 [Rhodotorula dairenensis]
MHWLAQGARVALLAASTAVTVTAAPIVATAGSQLTAKDWDQNVQRGGTWLVEHYSPYCSHCKTFAPTWKELVDTYRDAAGAHDFHFAQVDCAANGDLCHAHDVKYYPSIFLYSDQGQRVVEFEDRRTLSNLGKFVEDHYPVKAERLEVAKGTKAEEEGENKANEAWSAKEKITDEQVGMGKVKQAAVGEVAAGAGKARLPKVAASAEVDNDEDFAGDGADALATDKQLKPVLHIVDEPTSSSSPSDSTREEGVGGLRPDPTDGSERDSEVNEEESLPPILTSQTPPAAVEPTLDPGQTKKTNKFNPPPFVAQQPPPPPSALDKKRANAATAPAAVDWPAVDGTVLELGNDLGIALVEGREDVPPSFVKYFAPWCSHCKAMAPAWKELAEDLAADGVRVYQIDCDAKENKKACKVAKVQSYPTIKFYNAGASVEYLGKRDKESMKTFALKAMAATTVKTLSTEGELLRAIQDDQVVVLLLQPKGAKKDDVEIALGAAKTLMGTSPVYSTSAPALFGLHSIPEDQLTFVTFKAHARDPYDVFAVPLRGGGTSRQRLEATRHWLRSAKVPLVSELNAATFPELMPSSTGGMVPPLVGLAVLSRRGLGTEGLERAKESVAEMAKAWVVERRRKRQEAGKEERDVLWAWVDGDKWAGWARSMYDVKLGARDGPKVVIADPKRMEYWKTTVQGSPLELDREAVFRVVEQGPYARRIKPQSSRQFLERFAYAFVDRITSTLDWIATHPLLFMVGLSLGAYLVWLAVKKAARSAFGPGSSTATSNLASKKLGAGAGGLISRGGYAPIPQGGGAKRE